MGSLWAGWSKDPNAEGSLRPAFVVFLLMKELVIDTVEVEARLYTVHAGEVNKAGWADLGDIEI